MSSQCQNAKAAKFSYVRCCTDDDDVLRLAVIHHCVSWWTESFVIWDDVSRSGHISMTGSVSLSPSVCYCLWINKPSTRPGGRWDTRLSAWRITDYHN